MERCRKGGRHAVQRSTGDLEQQVKKLDGPLDRTRITLKPVDPEVLREQWQREIWSRLGVCPDAQIPSTGSTDDE